MDAIKSENEHWIICILDEPDFILLETEFSSIDDARSFWAAHKEHCDNCFSYSIRHNIGAKRIVITKEEFPPVLL